MNERLDAFKADIIKGIEDSGLTSANITEIAEKHGFIDKGLMWGVPEHGELFFMWHVADEAGKLIIDLLKENDAYNIRQCSPVELLLLCGYDGLTIPRIPLAKRFMSYKTPHLFPVYIYKEARK